jgi:tyrosine-protein phosphatase SIW14
MNQANDAASPTGGRSRRLGRRAFLIALMAVVAAWPAYHFFWRYHIKRFQVVREGVFYRVAQPTEYGLRYLVNERGVRTVLSLRLEDDDLRPGLVDRVLDGGDADGTAESQFVAELGVRHLQWPMGREACWPWVTPWQFEEFFRLLDDPDNWPVAIHCVGGRHRTGTLSALFRLEYDRWPVERALAEMYSFQFGPRIPLQEFNLRTYAPRPHPSEQQWRELQRAWTPLVGEPPQDYEELVRLVAARRREAAVETALRVMLERDRPFALPLAQRLTTNAGDSLAETAASAAARCLARGDAIHDESKSPEAHAAGSPAGAFEQDVAMAAAIIADFGSPEDQRELMRQLEAGSREPNVSRRYDALVAGVANRYTPNRIAFLQALIDDERPMPRPGADGCRYCDLAVVHLAAIVDQRLLPGGSDPRPDDWDRGRALARQWLTAHADSARLCQLRPPTGHTQLHADSSPTSARDAALRR